MDGAPSAQEIATRLADVLSRKGLRQKDLAKAAGVSEGAVSGWLAAEADEDLRQWRRLAAACRKLGISADEILGVVPAPDPGPSPRAVSQALKKLEEARTLLGGQPTDEQLAADLEREALRQRELAAQQTASSASSSQTSGKRPGRRTGG